MTLDEAIVAHLQNTSAVRALVEKRVHPGAAPEAPQKPFVVFSETGGADVGSMDGPSGLRRTDIQFDCWAPRKLEASAVAEQITAALDGFSGHMGAAGAEPGLEVSPCLLMEPRGSDFDPDLKLHAVTRQFRFWHHPR